MRGRGQRGSRGRLPAPALGSSLCREIVLLSSGFFPHGHNPVDSFIPPAAVGFCAFGMPPGVAPALTCAASLAGPSESVEEIVAFLRSSLWKTIRIETG